MNIVYFDTVGGISGDMTLGALVHAGVPLDRLREDLKGLGLSGFELEAKHVQRSGITALKIDVVVSGEDTHHRHFSDIKNMIAASSLSPAVKKCAVDIFATLAAAEAKVHDVPVEKIHFHEVGAVDSIVDIVGTAICLEYLGIEAVYSSPVKIGAASTIKSAHGIIPVPAPATLEILRGYPVVMTDAPYELATPTGAAIIKTLSRGTLSSEELIVDSIGYGSGSRSIDEFPNLLRAAVGSLRVPAAEDGVIVVDANIDDMNPELYPYVIDKLVSEGARDAFITPVIMKKGRPGVLLTVLAPQDKLQTVIRLLHTETATTGVRYYRTDRKILERGERTVETEFGPLRVKAVDADGRTYLKPEFEDAKRIAIERNIPLIEVYRRLRIERE